MSKISLQDIFNAAYQKFVVEMAPLAKTAIGCSYLTSDGRKCGIGLVLPDNHSWQSSEASFGLLVLKYPQTAKELFDESVFEVSEDDLSYFQTMINDTIPEEADQEYRRDRYISVANRFNPKLPE